ncbi:MAG: signal recognition particle-docking protein FtsY [Erysipelotrichaceae bacterium]|nr:signal recognition particle-docking protein FtsY [Erysipelotrichaceae bacterium]
MGFFDFIKNAFFKRKSSKYYLSGFRQTSRSFNEKLNFLKKGYTVLNDAFLEELMITLIQSDIGVSTSQKIVDTLRKKATSRNISYDDVKALLYESMTEVYGDATYTIKEGSPTVIFLVGVNGSGKTTSAAKLAAKYTEEGKKVLLVAADTFRAGAIEQLAKWAKKLRIECLEGKENSDPSSVIVDGLRYAKEHGFDLVLCDTAGRLQNKTNLMNELSKMKRVAGREIPGAPHAVWLVIDATTGQNGLSQASVFMEATDVSGIILTKMDGTAKGGVILAIKDQLKVPVVYVGCGESVEALREFELDSYIYSIAEGINYDR